MNNNNKIIINGTLAGLIEHYSGLLPRSILDHYQSDSFFFKTYKDTFRKMYSDNGIKTFYKFNIPMLTSISLAHIWLFNFYELHKNTENNLYSVFYSSIAKIGHDIIMTPGDTIRMINNVSGKNNTYIIKNLYYKNGLFAFFRSSPISLLMNIPVGVIEFSSMKYFMNNYENKTKNYFIFGGFTGILSSIVSNPLDIIKTNIQLQGCTNKYSYKKYPHFNSMICSCKHTYNNLTIKGLFRGTLLRSFQMSLCFGTYECLSDHLLKH